MDRYKIYIRLELLFDCLVFCSDFRKIFTTGERIMINQERGRLMHILTNELEDPYPVSNDIEEKINEVLRLKKIYKFYNFKKDPLTDEEKEENQHPEL